MNGTAKIATVADDGVGWTGLVVGITNAAVFSDHAACSDGDLFKGNQVHASRNDDIVSNDDVASFLGFKVELAIEVKIFAELDVSCAL